MAMHGLVSRRQFVLFQRHCNALAYGRVLKCDKELNRMDVNAYSLFFFLRVSLVTFVHSVYDGNVSIRQEN